MPIQEKTKAVLTAIRPVVYILFFALVLKTIFTDPPAVLPPVPGRLLTAYLSGQSNSFIPTGAEFSMFKGSLPPKGPVTFLGDVPFNPYSPDIDQLYKAQSFFTPLLLNPAPVERVAIVYCSQASHADLRMQETGYRLIKALHNGKGMAVKK